MWIEVSIVFFIYFYKSWIFICFFVHLQTYAVSSQHQNETFSYLTLLYFSHLLLEQLNCTIFCHFEYWLLHSEYASQFPITLSNGNIVWQTSVAVGSKSNTFKFDLSKNGTHFELQDEISKFLTKLSTFNEPFSWVHSIFFQYREAFISDKVFPKQELNTYWQTFSLLKNHNER